MRKDKDQEQAERYVGGEIRIIVKCMCLLWGVCGIGCDSGFSMSGSVVDKLGNPVSDVTVDVSSTDDVYLQPLRSITDEKGAFLHASFGQKQNMRTVSISAHKSGFAPVKIQLPLGLQTKGVVIELVPLNVAPPPLP